MGLINFILGLALVYYVGKFFLSSLIHVPFFWVILLFAVVASFFKKHEIKKKA